MLPLLVPAMALGEGGDAEEWLTMALRAAGRAAVGPKAARAARWQAYEVSYERSFVVVRQVAVDTACEDLELVLAQVKEVSGRHGKLTVVHAKERMRSFGAEGTRAASQLSRLSKARNASAHSLALQLLVTVRQLGQGLVQEGLMSEAGAPAGQGLPKDAPEPEAELSEGREALAGQDVTRPCTFQVELDALRAELAGKSAESEAASELRRSEAAGHAQAAAAAAQQLEEALMLVDRAQFLEGQLARIEQYGLRFGEGVGCKPAVGLRVCISRGSCAGQCGSILEAAAPGRHSWDKVPYWAVRLDNGKVKEVDEERLLLLKDFGSDWRLVIP